MSLPEAHLRVFDEIKRYNKNIIVILSNGSALDLRTLKQDSRAILETWFLGGAAATPIVDILVGKISPSGRLQETFPLTLKNTPHDGTFPQKVNVDYRQDLLANGYRYYDTHSYDVLYPFGYGLSYADIQYKDVEWIQDFSNKNSFMKASVTLENTSSIDAYETIQVYVQAKDLEVIKPMQELKAFDKVYVKANETKTVVIHIPFKSFETYSEHHHQFLVYNGTYNLRLGRHSRDILFEKEVKILEGVNYKPVMDLTYPMEFLVLYYPKWAQYIEEHFRPLWWHEKEEPIWRIIDRYKRHKQISDEEIASLIEQIKKDIN